MLKNIAMASSKTPRIVKFGYVEYNVEASKRVARCKFCQDRNVISDGLCTTSNFVRHMERVHRDRYVSFN